MKTCAAISCAGFSSAATPTARIPIRSSAWRPSAGWSRACARRWLSCCPELRGDLVYNQVPALSTGDRGMLDLLTLDRNARLVVLELKADEDLHLPLQALDYWMRVRALNADRQPAAGTTSRSLPSRAAATFPASNFRRSRRASSSPRPHCAFIPPMSRCCATSRPRSSGSSSPSPSIGAASSRSSSASAAGKITQRQTGHDQVGHIAL